MESDAEDFTNLYNRSYRVIARYILARVDDRALAEDLTAETFARGLEKQRGGLEITVGWLIRTARNLVGNEYQRRDRDRARLERMAVEELAGTTTQDDLDADIDVRAAMARLRPADALVLQLTYWDGLSAAEAAAFLGCSTGALWVRLTRARASMRLMLTEDSRRPAQRSDEGGDRNG